MPFEVEINAYWLFLNKLMLNFGITLLYNLLFYTCIKSRILKYWVDIN